MESMTGFGTARGEVGRSRFLVEVRSVNHRYRDVSVRMPGRLSVLEADIVSHVRSKFGRGKFDLFVKEESAGRGDSERETARRCHRLLHLIQKDLRLSGPITLSELLMFWNLFQSGRSTGLPEPEKLRRGLTQIVSRALQRLSRMRQREGRHLKKWFQGRLRLLARLLRQIEKQAARPGTLLPSGVSTGLEEANWRGDVTEELVRLKRHLQQFPQGLSQGGAGRRMDFLVQEMIREINTVGAKVSGVAAVHHVINFKTEIEKIREQVQNVE